MLFLPASQKARDHGVACANGIDQLSFGCGEGVDLVVFVDEDGALAGHGDEDVDGAHLAEFPGVGDDGLAGVQLHAEDLTDLVVVGLDEEGVVLEDVEQEVFGGVDDEADAAALECLEDVGVDGAGHALGDAAGENEGVTLLQCIELCHEGVLGVLVDDGAHAVDLGAVDVAEFEIDPGEAVADADEVVFEAHLLHAADQFVSGEARDEAEGGAVDAEVGEDGRDVDALAAGQHLFIDGAVGLAQLEARDGDDVVE